MARAVIDLPQPDSPTSARTSPEATLNDTPATATTGPSSVFSLTVRSSTCQLRIHRQPLGSSTSRSPSPSRLNDMVVSAIARPGNRAKVGALLR